MKILFMFPFWVNDNYIVVYAKDNETAKKRAIEKYKKLYE